MTPPEGVSLAPVFKGAGLERGKPIFWEHEGNRAVRDGRWKLVAKGVKGDWELYDMVDDRTETKDLAGVHPERVKRMAADYAGWAKRCGVAPFNSWRKDKKAR